jgi:hypothetical protein
MYSFDLSKSIGFYSYNDRPTGTYTFRILAYTDDNYPSKLSTEDLRKHLTKHYKNANTTSQK